MTGRKAQTHTSLLPETDHLSVTPGSQTQPPSVEPQLADQIVEIINLATNGKKEIKRMQLQLHLPEQFYSLDSSQRISLQPRDLSTQTPLSSLSCDFFRILVPNPNYVALMNQFCRRGPVQVATAFQLVLSRLTSQSSNAIVRILCLHLLNELFQHSHRARDEILDHWKEFCTEAYLVDPTAVRLLHTAPSSVSAQFSGTKKGRERSSSSKAQARKIPGPSNALQVLQQIAVDLIDSWVAKCGASTPKLNFAYEWIRNTKAIGVAFHPEREEMAKEELRSEIRRLKDSVISLEKNQIRLLHPRFCAVISRLDTNFSALLPDFDLLFGDEIEAAQASSSSSSSSSSDPLIQEPISGEDMAARGIDHAFSISLDVSLNYKDLLQLLNERPVEMERVTADVILLVRYHQDWVSTWYLHLQSLLTLAQQYFDECEMSQIQPTIISPVQVEKRWKRSFRSASRLFAQLNVALRRARYLGIDLNRPSPSRTSSLADRGSGIEEDRSGGMIGLSKASASDLQSEVLRKLDCLVQKLEEEQPPNDDGEEGGTFDDFFFHVTGPNSPPQTTSEEESTGVGKKRHREKSSNPIP